MNDLEYQDDGSVIPTPEGRASFASDLRQAIKNQIFEGEEIFKGKVRGKTVTCKLPSANQFLDFVTVRATEEKEVLEISLTIPSFESEQIGFTTCFTYIPPHPDVQQ